MTDGKTQNNSASLNLRERERERKVKREKIYKLSRFRRWPSYADVVTTFEAATRPQRAIIMMMVLRLIENNKHTHTKKLYGHSRDPRYRNTVRLYHCILENSKTR